MDHEYFEKDAQRSIAGSEAASTKKAAWGGCFFEYEDAMVGLLVPSSWFFRFPPSLQSASGFQTRICSCIGLPRHSAIDSFPSSSMRSFHSDGQFALTIFASGSAFMRPPPPNTDRASVLRLAGRLSASELAGAEAFASK